MTMFDLVNVMKEILATLKEIAKALKTKNGGTVK